MAEHNELGALGEQLAKEHLIDKGYRILEQNWRQGRLEVDLIALFGDLLVFVEVKTRHTDFFGTPESFVDRKKQNMLAEAAEIYIGSHLKRETELRYDIVSVIFNQGHCQSLRHIEDAFFPDDLNLGAIDF